MGLVTVKKQATPDTLSVKGRGLNSKDKTREEYHSGCSMTIENQTLEGTSGGVTKVISQSETA